ncbi:MAG: hypothetical protein Q4F00_02100 [bacterium]|nr:hypothetical protein [bacterium]
MRRWSWAWLVLALLFVSVDAAPDSQAAGLPDAAQNRRSYERFVQNNGVYPDWQSEKLFYVNDLHLLMSGEEIADALGEAGRTIDEGFNVYGDDIVIRLRDGVAVNISVTGGLGSWKLHRDQVTYAAVGDAKKQVLDNLGKPFARYVREDKAWEILLYAARTSDVGLFMINDQVAGFMLTEPGLLGFSLQYKGFKIADI